MEDTDRGRCHPRRARGTGTQRQAFWIWLGAGSAMLLDLNPPALRQVLEEVIYQYLTDGRVVIMADPGDGVFRVALLRFQLRRR